MVKGISKQVIVVHSPEPELFEQAIFILKENVSDVTDAQLLREAKLAMRQEEGMSDRVHPFFWAMAGACMVGLAWALSLFF